MYFTGEISVNHGLELETQSQSVLCKNLCKCAPGYFVHWWSLRKSNQVYYKSYKIMIQAYSSLSFLFFILFPAPAVWYCWQSEPGSHTELCGRLACCLSTTEANNWWHFAYSPQRYLPITEHGSHSRNQWCHPEDFWEESWQRGVAGLGRWHSKPHRLSFRGHHWCTVDNKHPARRTC